MMMILTAVGWNLRFNCGRASTVFEAKKSAVFAVHSRLDSKFLAFMFLFRYWLPIVCHNGHPQSLSLS